MLETLNSVRRTLAKGFSMFRWLALCFALGVLCSRVSAQSPEQTVMQANAALLAASVSGDKAAYIRLLGDDLRWVEGDGRVLTKAQRLAMINGPSTMPRTFSHVEVTVYGHVAVLLARVDWAAGDKKISERVQRVFVNRSGGWQLVTHSPTPMDPNAP